MPVYGSSAKCPRCGKSVYANEEKLGAGKKWHKLCFKCSNCNKLLESTNVAEHEGDLFCKSCHGKSFGPKGYGFGGGAGTLSMEGAGVGDTKPANSAGGGGAVIPPDQGGCPRCGKRVYKAEETIGAGMSWHKSCFRCKTCGKSLDSTTMNNRENEIYCKGCYGKEFGPKGFGFGQGAGALSRT